MRGVLRLFLIWFMAMVIPLKGVAAVTTIGCGPGHHGATAAAKPGSSSRSVAHHGADRAVKQGHDGGSLGASLADPPSGDAPKQSAIDQSKSFSKVIKLKCSGCAPCCAAAAPAFEPARVPQAHLGSCGLSFEDTRFVGVDVDVPHRPPRLILA